MHQRKNIPNDDLVIEPGLVNPEADKRTDPEVYTNSAHDQMAEGFACLDRVEIPENREERDGIAPVRYPGDSRKFTFLF